MLDPLTAPEPSQETGPGSSLVNNHHQHRRHRASFFSAARSLKKLSLSTAAPDKDKEDKEGGDDGSKDDARGPNAAAAKAIPGDDDDDHRDNSSGYPTPPSSDSEGKDPARRAARSIGSGIGSGSDRGGSDAGAGLGAAPGIGASAAPQLHPSNPFSTTTTTPSTASTTTSTSYARSDAHASREISPPLSPQHHRHILDHPASPRGSQHQHQHQHQYPLSPRHRRNPSVPTAPCSSWPDKPGPLPPSSLLVPHHPHPQPPHHLHHRNRSSSSVASSNSNSHDNGNSNSNRNTTTTTLQRHRSLRQRYPGDMSHRPLDMLRADARAAERGPHQRHRKRISRDTDTIDALDNTVGGIPYHHGGPYDATLTSRNLDVRYSPVAAVRASNEAALRATPRENIMDSLERHVPLQGTASIPPGARDMSGRVMDYDEGADLMREPDADGGAYKRWPGVQYHPEDYKGKGEPSFTIERDLKARKHGKHLSEADAFEMYPGANRRTVAARQRSASNAEHEGSSASGNAYGGSGSGSGSGEGLRRNNTTGKRLSDGIKRRFGSLRHKKSAEAH
ncbi:hypothetical protein JDV02_008920 [Purpureocillium takamizusanense]|uniref:Protein kinase n=1 Tax=Purpureocillium takamizusanense TaxID=2060973 RepID=A0A9Q8QPU2_9HYPO|nr:uncharacterized protein JDV02_008920 [Purpureocillium takamizusanense]UNI23081.1 hypothetical protein JDV02_008920 [Purpureocillium takamizusanense]